MGVGGGIYCLKIPERVAHFHWSQGVTRRARLVGVLRQKAVASPSSWFTRATSAELSCSNTSVDTS